MIDFCPTCCETDLGEPCIDGCGMHVCNVCEGTDEHYDKWHIWEAWQE